MAMATVPALWATGSFASTVDDLENARRRVAEARAATNEAVAAFTSAENQLAETERRIATLEASIVDLERKADVLQDVVRQRAVYAYTHKGQDLDLVIEATSPVAAARRSQLLDRANQHDNDDVRRLAAINEDLRRMQESLRAQETQEQAVKEQLATKAADLQAKLDEAQRASAALRQKLDGEIAVLAAAVTAQENTARLQALQAERAQVVGTQTVSNVGAGQIIGTPIGGFACPVSGASYSNDFGGLAATPGSTCSPPPAPPRSR
jgi:septal ring factor EnvC (AmiA/AmiB activator)